MTFKFTGEEFYNAMKKAPLMDLLILKDALRIEINDRIEEAVLLQTKQDEY